MDADSRFVCLAECCNDLYQRRKIPPASRALIPILVQTDCHIDPNQVCDILVSTAVKQEDALEDPTPNVYILNCANNVTSFQLNVWQSNPLDGPRVQSEVKTLVWNAFKQKDISLPFPEMELLFPKQVSVQAMVAGAEDRAP